MKNIGVLFWLLSCALRDLGVSQDRFKDFRPGVVFDELHSKIIWGVLSNVPSAPMANAMMSERRNRIHPCLCVIRGSPRAILARLNLYGITVIRVLQAAQKVDTRRAPATSVLLPRLILERA